MHLFIHYAFIYSLILFILIHSRLRRAGLIVAIGYIDMVKVPRSRFPLRLFGISSNFRTERAGYSFGRCEMLLIEEGMLTKIFQFLLPGITFFGVIFVICALFFPIIVHIDRRGYGGEVVFVAFEYN